MEKEAFTSFIAFDPAKPTKDSNYYWEHRHQNIKPIWVNFIFGAFWFLYRRMYLTFILMYGVVGYGLQFYFSKMGYDWGASGAYSTMIINFLSVMLGHGLFIRFAKYKSQKLKHLGTQVRLFTPFAILMRNIFLILVIQCFGVWFNIDLMIKAVYPFLYASFFYMIALYIYYFIDWMNS